MTGTGGTKGLCTTLPPISWSKKDTDATIKDIKAHNAAYKAMCK